jgi:2-polyprenylphenol 6-hydroxylase
LYVTPQAWLLREETMAESQHFDVAIVGAGIAGSALATALSGQGRRIALIEAQPLSQQALPTEKTPQDYDSRVSALTPKSKGLLERTGAWPQVEAYRLCPYRHMTVWDAQGTGEIDFDADEVGASALGYIVENRAITRALQSRVRECADITLFNPAKLVEYQRLSDGTGQLTLDDGRLLQAQLLVAADGALSNVRQMLDFATREWDYGHRAIVATVQTERPHQETAWQRFMPSGPLAFLPLPGTQGRHYCSIVWSQQEAVADRLLGLEDAEFCRELGAALENRLGSVIASSARIAFPLRQRHAVDYVQPGVALIGDAAHTIHPLAGQGINLGLQDVDVLAEEVGSGWKRGINPGELVVLKRYQRRRKGDNLLMMGAMDGFKRLFEQQSLPVRWLRNAGMRRVASLGPLKQQIMKQAMGL